MTRAIICATRLALLITLACLSAIPAHAQNTGIIEGAIADESGAVLPGATVTLRNADTGVERTAVADSEGRYRFPALQPGDYTVRVDLSGFASQELRHVVITIGLDIQHDFRLKIQTLSETVTVTAEAPVVDVTKSEVASVVTQKQMESLP